MVNHDRTPLPVCDALTYTPTGCLPQLGEEAQSLKPDGVAGQRSGRHVLEGMNLGFEPLGSKASGPVLSRVLRLWFRARLAFRQQGRKLFKPVLQAGSVRQVVPIGKSYGGHLQT